MRARSALATASVVAFAFALTGCASAGWDEPRSAPAAVGSAAPGFVPEVRPSPEATIEPAAGSWDGVSPAPGYRVVLLTAGADAETQTIARSVRDWATATSVDLRTVTADEHDPIPGIVDAMERNPDLVIVAGEHLIDPLAIVSANHLDRSFLVIGAEIAEPTENVTAVDWTGASFRGEGLGSASDYDPATFTPERTGDAVRAGVAAVLSDLNGLVIWID
ncbi:hypothetical protein ACI3KT_18280 [Microbacterium sp. ZW T6_19]|uniref:hypothetical protein n=1 Tax=Microbacterium sp. ZW T6_19 TaxID=3378082 RepID=UPI0038518EC9